MAAYSFSGSINLMSKKIFSGNDKQVSLELFLTQALQNPDWQKLEVILPGETKVKSYSRGQCLEFLKNGALSRLAQLEPDLCLGEDPATPATLKKLQEFLLVEQINPGNSALGCSVQRQYQNHLIYQTSLIRQKAVVLASAGQAREAAYSVKNVEEQLEPEIAKLLDKHLHRYPPEYREEIKKAMTQRVRRLAFSRLDENLPLDANFGRDAVDSLRYEPLFRAAITNTQTLEKDLAEIDKTGVGKFWQEYKNFRNYQIDLNPAYENLYLELTATGKLSPDQAKEVIRRFDEYATRYTASPNPYIVSENLKDALGNLRDQINLNYEMLGWQVCADIIRHQPYLSPQTMLLASRLNKNGLDIDPRAINLYINGVSSSQLTGYWKDQVKKLEEVRAKRIIGGPERKVKKEYRRAVKKRQKIEKAYRKYQQHEAWKEKMSQSRIGWVRTPRMRFNQWFAQSRVGKGWTNWGRTILNFKENSPFGWFLAPHLRAKNALGNWIIDNFSKKGRNLVAEHLGTTLIRNGFLKFGGELAKQGLIKLGLGFLVGGPVGGIISGVWTGIKAFYDIFKDPRMRQKILKFVGTVVGGIIYLILKFPFTFLGAILGFSIGGPLGLLIGGGLGFLLDKAVAAIGGINGILNTAGTTAVSAAGSLETALSMPAAAASAPFSFSAIAVPVFGAIGLPAVLGILTITTISSSMYAEPDKERGGGISGPINAVKDYNYAEIELLAAEIVNQLQSCGIDVESQGINKNNWYQVENCLKNLNTNSSAVIDALRHSVWEVENSQSLQCVGFVMASLIASGRQLAPHNAAAYTIDGTHPGWTKTNSPSVGDLAVWGPKPYPACEYNNLDTVEAINEACNKNTDCCGHIGIVTKIEDGITYITSAWDGTNGIINTIPIRPGVEAQPWIYLH